MAFERTTIELANGWKVKSEDQDGIWYNSLPLPTTIHQDLLANKVISDPYLAKNEEQVQWVGTKVWTYRTSFHTPPEVRAREDVTKILAFDGLDTYATVRLNGETILEADNMFLTYRVDVSNVVKPDDTLNSLEITFDNAERRGDAEVAKHPEHEWTTFDSGNARLATRKSQCHYGWDWGPKLMTCGPWRPVYLDMYKSRIRDVVTLSSLNDDLDNVRLDTTIETEGNTGYASIDISQAGSVVASTSLNLNPSGTTQWSISIQKPKLWWPHTLGKQNLYSVKVSLYSSASSHRILDTMAKRIGIRRVSLVRRPFCPQEGSSFFFKINSVPVFCSGSNWIPGDCLQPRMSSTKYRRWIELAKRSNQVMIRVWGGGIYESGAFYNACDELGILVWQDFMLACGMFPAYESFLKQIETEVEDNLRKLRHHPSIVLWCGNNEDYVIPLLSDIPYDANETSRQAILSSRFPARWIYEHLLPDICGRLSPDVPYWPGSPWGGEMVNSVKEGDCHQWHVWHLEKFPYQDYSSLTTRFASEFGMQSMPNLRTTLEYFPANYDLSKRKDWTEDEYVMFHNKAGGGQDTLHEYCDYNLPEFDTAKFSLKRLIYCTQLVQSEAMRWALSSWRRDWKGLGREYCGGALIWQHSDCWPVTSWSLIDYKLRPKMAFWTAKRENAPVTAGLRRVTSENGVISLEAWFVNMTLQDIKVDAVLRAWNAAGGKPIWSKIIASEFVCVANQCTELTCLTLNHLQLDSTQNYRDIVFAFDITTPGTQNQVWQAINFHEPLKAVLWSSPKSFQARIVSRNSKTVVALLSSTALKGVLLDIADSDEVEWGDNGFDMLPDQPKHVEVTGLREGEEGRLQVYWLGGEWSLPETQALRSNL